MPNYTDDFYYILETYATELYTEEPNTGAANLSNQYYRVSKTTAISTTQKLIYRIKIYSNTDVIIEDGGTTISGSTVKSRVLGTGAFATFKTKISSFAKADGIRTIADKYYDFTVTATKSGNVTPTFDAQVQVNGIWRDVKVKPNAAANQKIITMTFTKAAKPPAEGVPDTVKAHDYKDSLGDALPGSQTGPYEWNSCKKYWVRYWREGVTYVPGGADSLKDPAYYRYTVQTKYFDKNGDPINPKTVTHRNPKRTDGKEETKNGGFYAKGSASQQALKVLNDAKLCASATPGTGGNTTVITTPESVKKADNFNPYPHIATRHFAARIWDDSKKNYSDDNVYDQLASFYIDPDTVDITSGKAPNADKYSKAAALNRFWGFRFLYNPQYLSYSMNSNSQVDWTRPNENGAVLVAAGIGGYITVNILLDRVADMNTMRAWKRDQAAGTVLQRGPYPVDMDPEQCAGILHRGTEYDLEYLFRVLNGNPQESTLLGKNPKDKLEMLTANMGYIAQIPFVFKVSDHMRYKVVLSSLSIEHSMFTREMIPIRSVVQIQLERIPDIPTKGSKFLQADALNNLSPIIKANNATNPYSGYQGKKA